MYIVHAIKNVILGDVIFKDCIYAFKSAHFEYIPSIMSSKIAILEDDIIFYPRISSLNMPPRIPSVNMPPRIPSLNIPSRITSLNIPARVCHEMMVDVCDRRSEFCWVYNYSTKSRVQWGASGRLTLAVTMHRWKADLPWNNGSSAGTAITTSSRIRRFVPRHWFNVTIRGAIPTEKFLDFVLQPSAVDIQRFIDFSIKLFHEMAPVYTSNGQRCSSPSQRRPLRASAVMKGRPPDNHTTYVDRKTDKSILRVATQDHEGAIVADARGNWGTYRARESTA